MGGARLQGSLKGKRGETEVWLGAVACSLRTGEGVRESVQREKKKMGLGLCNQEILIYRADIMTTGEASAIDRRIYSLHLLRGQGTPCQAGPHREAPGLVRKQKQE